MPIGPACSAAAGLVGTGIGALSPSIWALADSMPPWRLVITVFGAIAAHTAWLLAAHRQWERRDTPHRHIRPGAGPPRPTTVLTVVLVVAAFTATQFLLALTTLSVLVTPQYLGTRLGHTAGPADYLALALLAAALGTVAAAAVGSRRSTHPSPPSP